MGDVVMAIKGTDDGHGGGGVEQVAVWAAGGRSGAASAAGASAHRPGAPRPHLLAGEIRELQLCLGRGAHGQYDLTAGDTRAVGTGQPAFVRYAGHHHSHCGYLGPDIPASRSRAEVWELARQRIEQRMAQSGPAFGAGPGKGDRDDSVAPGEPERTGLAPPPDYRGRA